MGNFTVSVVMPAFNSEKTIEKALLSLCNQTYSDWECIVVDDGSVDSTALLATKIGDPRIKVYSLEKNMGRPYARQYALSKTEGKYLAMLDSDDWITSDKLQQQIRFFQSNPEVDAVSGGMFIEDETKLVGVRGGGTGKVWTVNDPFSLNFPHAATMLKMNIAKNYDYDIRLKHSQDSDFLRRALFGRNVVLLPDFIYCYAEWESVTYKKVVRSFWYSSIAASKWFRRYPIKTMIRIFQNLFKASLVQLAGVFGGFDSYLQARSKVPSAENNTKYYKERKIMEEVIRKYLN